jgi:L,D-peptidoglycan transpeptidase YkuD (ErfK/YbiS/YcfS/YnhG family)
MITKQPFRRISVRKLASVQTKGRLMVGQSVFPCALGKGGMTRSKREGDGGTPKGTFLLRCLWYRTDKGLRPTSTLPTRAIRPRDGWCDAPGHRRYNKPVALPFAASHERMWREDALYDIVIEIGWNDRPAISGRGSAIFLHIAQPGYMPTEGCVAVAIHDMRKLLPRLGLRTRIVIE